MASPVPEGHPPPDDRATQRWDGMKLISQTERGKEAAAAQQHASGSPRPADQHIRALARLLARVAARDAVAKPVSLSEQDKDT